MTQSLKTTVNNDSEKDASTVEPALPKSKFSLKIVQLFYLVSVYSSKTWS